MRFPDFIKENDIISYVAPSLSCGSEPYYSGFNKALQLIDDLGFKEKLGDNVYALSGIGISNTPVKCATELMGAYLDEETKAIISCGGGELMCETMSYVDFNIIKDAKPKWYMGYSDNTNFIFLLTTICDVAAIYGYCASTFGRIPYHQSQTDCFNLLMGKSLKVSNYDKFEISSLKSVDDPYAPFNLTMDSHLVAMDIDENDNNELIISDSWTNENIIIKTDGYVIKDEIAFEGRLVGGCLDCLNNIAGTRLDKVKDFNERYKEDGIIWFLECCDLNVFDMRRAMWHLYECGWFKHVKGFIIGRPMKPEGFFSLNRYDAFLDVAKKLNVPVIFDADIGHVPPMMPIISGAYAKVSFKDTKLDIDMQNVVK